MLTQQPANGHRGKTSLNWRNAPGTGFTNVRFRVVAVDLRYQNSFAERAIQITPGGATPVAGDIDGDGDVDSADQALFVSVLIGTDTDLAHMARADLSGDGHADGLDVQPFTNALVGG